MSVLHGCGLSVPDKCVNFDVFPLLRIQNSPKVISLRALIKNVI